ncbi:MAG TPA: AraC family transcriptional regulator [Pyrinomonadaceae bacterium]|nr:AraC family transcriptional regulator [Pyrinomonadaceae bacterium]
MEKRIGLLRKKILENPQLQWTIEDMSKVIGLNIRQLQRLIKVETDTTPSVWLRDLRLEKAKQLLENTFLNIGEICLKVGLNDHSHFTRDFKDKFGVTPTSYRKT